MASNGSRYRLHCWGLSCPHWSDLGHKPHGLKSPLMATSRLTRSASVHPLGFRDRRGIQLAFGLRSVITVCRLMASKRTKSARKRTSTVKHGPILLQPRNRATVHQIQQGVYRVFRARIQAPGHALHLYFLAWVKMLLGLSGRQFWLICGVYERRHRYCTKWPDQTRMWCDPTCGLLMETGYPSFFLPPSGISRPLVSHRFFDRSLGRSARP